MYLTTKIGARKIGRHYYPVVKCLNERNQEWVPTILDSKNNTRKQALDVAKQHMMLGGHLRSSRESNPPD